MVSKIIKDDISNIILIGPSGIRIQRLLILSGFKNRLFYVANLDDAFKVIPGYTPEGKICLLSPASASYDQFKDFAERGDYFKKKAGEL
jgi:UDP-N-acetylmuramoylalanine--D-glutamate ligase